MPFRTDAAETCYPPGTRQNKIKQCSIIEQYNTIPEKNKSQSLENKLFDSEFRTIHGINTETGSGKRSASRETQQEPRRLPTRKPSDCSRSTARIAARHVSKRREIHACSHNHSLNIDWILERSTPRPIQEEAP
jgi:hypothetical protein